MESDDPRQVVAVQAELESMGLDPEDLQPSVARKKAPFGDLFEAARAGDCARLAVLLDAGANVNARDRWDSVALYYACLAGHADAARMLLEAGAVCAERTFDGDRCHYAALNLRLRRLLRSFEARPPPLPPLPAALRATFLGCPANRRTFLEMLQGSAAAGSEAESLAAAGFGPTDNASSAGMFPPDITFYVDGRPIEAHRVVLSARSSFFKNKFKTDWRNRKEMRFSSRKLSFSALYSLIHFFYSDRLEVDDDDMEIVARACKVCNCGGLQNILDKEVAHQRYAQYKSLKVVNFDNSQRRFILQGQSLPEGDRLPLALHRTLRECLANSRGQDYCSNESSEICSNSEVDDGTDLYVKVCDKVFHCHQMILATRSEYFKTRLSRNMDFLEGKSGLEAQKIPFLEEHDLTTEAFEKVLEYMYTDKLEHMDPDQAEELFDVASRYLLFPLKRIVADMLLPHLERVTPAELCNWLMLSDMYSVLKVKEYCLDVISCNFEMFADTREFRALLLTFPPPSGKDSLRTTCPNAPGTAVDVDQGNLLDDLREKWLEAEAAELDERDESAKLFDMRLEILMLVAEQEANDEND